MKYKDRTHFEEELVKSINNDLEKLSKAGEYTVKHSEYLGEQGGEHHHKWSVRFNGKHVGDAFSAGESKKDSGSMTDFNGDKLHNNGGSHQHMQDAITDATPDSSPRHSMGGVHF